MQDRFHIKWKAWQTRGGYITHLLNALICEQGGEFLCLECLLNHLFRRRSKKMSKPRRTGLCEGNPPVTGGFLSQRASDAEMFPFDDVIMPSVLTHGVTIMTHPSCTVSVTDSSTRDMRQATAAPHQLAVTVRRFCRLSDIYFYLKLYILHTWEGYTTIDCAYIECNCNAA